MRRLELDLKPHLEPELVLIEFPRARDVGDGMKDEGDFLDLDAHGEDFGLNAKTQRGAKDREDF